MTERGTRIPERLLPAVDLFRPGKPSKTYQLSNLQSRRNLWRDIFWHLVRGKSMSLVPQYNPQLEAWLEADRQHKKEKPQHD